MCIVTITILVLYMMKATLIYEIFGKKSSTNFEISNTSSTISDDNSYELKLDTKITNNDILYMGDLFWKSPQRPSVGLKLLSLSISISNFDKDNSFSFFQHGYQSWGFSTVYNGSERDTSPILQFLKTSEENYFTQHSGKLGDFISEGLTILYNSELKKGFIYGVADDSEQNTKFRVQLTRENKISSIEFIYDLYHLPDFKGNQGIKLTTIKQISITNDPYLAMDEYAKSLGKKNGVKRNDQPVPTGWCSWYYYYTGISEKIILDNLNEIKNRKLPIEFFQIDDGYQKEIGEWLIPNQKFPAGMGFLADEIKKVGLKPGIWLAPFLIRKNSSFYQMYPEALLKDENGNPIQAIWQPIWGLDDTYCMDITHPIALDYLEKVFRTMTKEWGYNYLKLDFLYAGSLDGVAYNGKISPAQKYRNALELIRKTVGKNTFLLGCGAPIMPSIGIFDGMRVSCDVTPFWSIHWLRKLLQDKHALSTESALINGLNRAFMHRNFWLNDPDCLIIRKDKNSMTYPQTILMATVMGLSGGMLLISDNLSTLDESRMPILEKSLALSKKCQKNNSIPLGFMESKFPGGIYNPGGAYGFWNPENKPSELKFYFPYPLPFEKANDHWTDEKFTAYEFDAETSILKIKLEPFQSIAFLIENE